MLTYSEPLSSKASQFSLYGQLWQVYCYVIASMANRIILLAVALIIFVAQVADHAQETVPSVGESLTLEQRADAHDLRREPGVDQIGKGSVS